MKKKFFVNSLKSILLVVLICTAAVPWLQTQNITVNAQSSGDLSGKVADLNKELEAIKAKRKAIEAQLNNELQNQNSLTSQIPIYDLRIQALQASVDEKDKTIQTLEAQIELTTAQINETKDKITKLEKRLTDLDELYHDRVKSNFQNTFKTSLDTFLEINSFDYYLLVKEFSTTLAQENQAISEELAASKIDLAKQKDDFNVALQQQTDLQAQVKAEQADMVSQQQGLAYQKTQKEKLLAQSKNTAANLATQRAAIIAIANQKQQEMDNYLLQIISYQGNGKPVKVGDPIGRMGRSGYVLNCNSNGCYYPDPDKEPCGGAHLHFEVAKKYTDGKYYRTNPLPYLQNSIVGPPLHSYYFTQYYQGNSGSYGSFPGFDIYGNFSSSVQGHPGIDIVGDSNCGTTIYSGVNGVISYYCRPFQWPGYRADPTFFAVIYDPAHDINITYMHLQKAPGVGC